MFPTFFRTSKIQLSQLTTDVTESEDTESKGSGSEEKIQTPFLLAFSDTNEKTASTHVWKAISKLLPAAI